MSDSDNNRASNKAGLRPVRRQMTGGGSWWPARKRKYGVGSNHSQHFDATGRRKKKP